MKLTTLFIFLLVAVFAVSAAGQTRPGAGKLSLKQIASIKNDAQTAIRRANQCLEEKNHVCTRKQLEQALTLLSYLPQEWQDEEEVLDFYWTCYLRLGLYKEAGRLWDRAPKAKQDEWMEDWNGMKETYGSISLDSPEVVRTDPTLSVRKVEVIAPPGGSREFPFDLVRERAGKEILSAFQKKDLVTDPIILPAGSQLLNFQLDRESGLNYLEPDLSTKFEVGSNATSPLVIDPKRDKPKLAVLGGLAALLITPFVMAR
jgi:hypothetical protein